MASTSLGFIMVATVCSHLLLVNEITKHRQYKEHLLADAAHMSQSWKCNYCFSMKTLSTKELRSNFLNLIFKKNLERLFTQKIKRDKFTSLKFR